MAGLGAIVCVIACLVAAAAAQDLARGWGESIAWRSFEAGKAEALTSQKPLMVIIHKTWCGACKALKPRVAESEAVAKLSEQFVMVNVQDEEEPSDPAYAPDGGYIPRIIFADYQGNVVSDLINTKGNPKYKYYYTDGDNVADGMRNALAHFAKKA